MVSQFKYGHLLGMNTTASENLPYYRFVGIKEDKFVLATADTPLVGVTVPSVQDYKINSDGTTMKRTGYYKDEQPQILNSGACNVELEDAVGRGDRITLGTTGGKAKKAEKDEKVIGMVQETAPKDNLAEVILKII